MLLQLSSWKKKAQLISFRCIQTEQSLLLFWICFFSVLADWLSVSNIPVDRGIWEGGVWTFLTQRNVFNLIMFHWTWTNCGLMHHIWEFTKQRAEQSWLDGPCAHLPSHTALVPLLAFDLPPPFMLQSGKGRSWGRGSSPKTFSKLLFWTPCTILSIFQKVGHKVKK